MSERNIVRVINRYGSDGSIALAARISYGAKHVESERVEPIINGLIANKEGTPFEFASMWFYSNLPLESSIKTIEELVSKVIEGLQHESNERYSKRE